MAHGAHRYPVSDSGNCDRSQAPCGLTLPSSTIPSMRRNSILLILLAALPWPALAQSHAPSKSHLHRAVDPDRLGMSCDQILNMTSSDWIAYFHGKSQIAVPASAPADATTRAIAAYGKCYDARTDALAALLARRGNGPLMGARGDFGEFDAALRDFTAQALAALSPPADATKTAYAALYEKQFRYAFYQSYAAKLEPAAKQSAPAAGPPAKSVTSQSPPAPSGAGSSALHKDDAGPLTKAKNYFGGLLGEFPDDKMHELHAAFGKALENYAIDPSTQLAVYRYAIFVLERPTAKPFSLPPF